jgi:hypothetical protein
VTIGLALGLGGGQLCRTPWILDTKPRPTHDGQTTRSPVQALLDGGQLLNIDIGTDPTVNADSDGLTKPWESYPPAPMNNRRSGCLNGQGPSYVTYWPGQQTYYGYRAMGADACYTNRVIPPGGSPATYNPDGLRDPLIRGHLIAHSLGGDGGNRDNIVPITQNPTNVQNMYHRMEKDVLKHVRAGETVYYQVVPLYNGDSVVPYALVMTAQSDTGWKEQMKFENWDYDKATGQWRYYG